MRAAGAKRRLISQSGDAEVNDYNPLNDLPALGVGVNYQKSFAELITQNSKLVDFVELNPDALASWQARGNTWCLSLNPKRAHEFARIRGNLPCIAHGLSLSIGSASGWNASYIELLDNMQNELAFPWHSEHLGFLDVRTASGYRHAGTQLPMPFSEAALALLVPRVQHIIARYNRPFLLENTTYYLPGIVSEQMDEIAFLNCLTEAAGPRCGVLLDLYNFYCNATNFGFCPYAALARLDKSRVVEIHLAGGSQYQGWHLDVHSAGTPEPVWNLLQWLLPQLPNVKALVFELLEQALASLGEVALKRELERAQACWRAAPCSQANTTSKGRHEFA